MEDEVIGQCPNCGANLTDSNVINNKDGDSYKQETNFWDVCSFCYKSLPDDWEKLRV
jgi:hypothetical protein